jgi:hypothetical protein
MLLDSLLMETDEKNSINHAHDKDFLTVHTLQKRVCHDLIMHRRKK